MRQGSPSARFAVTSDATLSPEPNLSSAGVYDELAIAASELPSGTLTFLFTDIEGSTRLLKQLGRERYGKLIAVHDRVLRAVLGEHGGIEVDRQGDSFFAVFRSAEAAVAAAAQVQQTLAMEEWPEKASVRVRIGLHTGEAALGGDGYVGLAVHRAARVGAAARG